MTLAQVCSVLASLVNIGLICFYVRDTYRGKVRPNLVSWVLWTLAPAIGVAGSLSQGYWWGALPTFASCFGPFLVLMAALLSKTGFWKIAPADWACCLLSVLALVLWGITLKAEIAILFAILSDGFAAWPTLKKSWQHPESESLFGYIGGFLGSFVSLFTLQDWHFAECAFPLYLILINVALVSSIAIGHRRTRIVA